MINDSSLKIGACLIKGFLRVDNVEWIHGVGIKDLRYSDPTSADQAEYNGNHSNHQKQVDQPTKCGRGERTKQPENNQKNRNRFKQDFEPRLWKARADKAPPS